MKTIKIPLYTFSELEKKAQKTALEHFRYINVNYHWWEDDYNDFKSLYATMGITIDKIYFRGFYSQGDGSCFSSTIDVPAFIKGIAEQSWKKYAPMLKLDIEKCPIHPRVIDLIDSGVDIEIFMKTDTNHRYYYVHYYSTHYMNSANGRTYTRIENELEKLDEWAEETLETLNNYLYQTLEDTYEHLTSDKVVQEVIEVNEYHFTSNGVHTDWLCEYSEL